MSLKAIARELGVSVGSVSVWTRDLELTEEQVAALAAVNPRHSQQVRGQHNRSQNARVKRLIAQMQGRALARRRDPLHQAGCMLYWAEGSKSRNTLQFVNSDPHMIRFFMRFLEECFAVARDRLVFSINCYVDNGLDIDAIEAWWLDELQLPATALRKHTINNPSASSQRQKRNLPYGTGRLVLHSTLVLQSIYGAIQHYADFDEPAWLG
jgi:hypothetical protein